jgi:hypothetical protein
MIQTLQTLRVYGIERVYGMIQTLRVYGFYYGYFVSSCFNNRIKYEEKVKHDSSISVK